MKPVDVEPGQLWEDRESPRLVVEVRHVTRETLPWVRYWRPWSMRASWSQLAAFKQRFQRHVGKRTGEEAA